MAITENESKLIAIFVQSCLWGAFAVMFVLTYWTLVHRRPRGRPLNKSMLGVAILMFVLATTVRGSSLHVCCVFAESSIWSSVLRLLGMLN